MPSASPSTSQRRLLPAWVARRYQARTPELRAEVERIDRWMASPAGLALWAGLLFAIVASVAGLVLDGGFPWPLALGSSMIVWLGLPAVALGAWLQPHKFTARRMWRNGLSIGALAYAGALLGFLVGHVGREGGLQLETLVEALRRSALASLPLLAVLLSAMMLLLWGVATLRRAQDQRELARLALEQERDAAARRAAEARLQLLQAQIQPHFIFNTLAALQHWVDSGDARAGDLLRALTAFLRGSTELLGRDSVRLDAEFETVRQYLAILRARLGQRLSSELDLAPECAGVLLPSGLLLTLVENAVEHGVAPALQGGRVQVRAWRDGDALRLSVCDDGIGLADGWADGIGLANCRERLRHHSHGDGTLQLRPRQPGTEAQLVLPGVWP